METDSAQQPLAELEPVAPQRRHHPLRWTMGVFVIAALIAGSVAVAGNDTTAWPATVVLSSAAARTTGTGTAQAALSGTLTLNGATSKIFSGEGAYDYGAHTSKLTLDLGPASVEIRNVRDTSYLAVPFGALPHGAHWLSVTAADLKVDPQAGAIFNSNDPSSGLQLLTAVGDDPRVVGKETLNDVDVTHYEFTLDLRPLVDGLGKADEALKTSSFGRQLEALGDLIDLTKVPGAAWIDNDGRVRKFTITFEATMDGEHGKMVDEFRFSHFNEPVDVHAPDASDTVSFSDVPDFFANGG